MYSSETLRQLGENERSLSNPNTQNIQLKSGSPLPGDSVLRAAILQELQSDLDSRKKAESEIAALKSALTILTAQLNASRDQHETEASMLKEQADNLRTQLQTLTMISGRRKEIREALYAAATLVAFFGAIAAAVCTSPSVEPVAPEQKVQGKDHAKEDSASLPPAVVRPESNGVEQ